MSDAAPSTPSRWDDYLDIFIAPSRAFERRRDGHFGHAMLVFIVLSALIYFGTKAAMDPIIVAEFARGMRSRPGMTPEQMEQAKGFIGIGSIIFVFIGTPIMLFVMGLATWLAAKLIGTSLTVAQGIAILTLSEFPRLVGSVLSALQALLMDEQNLTALTRVSLGLGRFIDPDTGNKLALAFLARVDLITLWITLLVAIGLKVVAKASTGQAVLGAAIVWLIGALPLLAEPPKFQVWFP